MQLETVYAPLLWKPGMYVAATQIFYLGNYPNGYWVAIRDCYLPLVAPVPGSSTDDYHWSLGTAPNGAM